MNPKITRAIDKIYLTFATIVTIGIPLVLVQEREGFKKFVISFSVLFFGFSLFRRWVKWVLKDFIGKETNLDEQYIKDAENSGYLFAENLSKAFGFEKAKDITRLFSELSKGDEFVFVQNLNFINESFKEKGTNQGIVAVAAVLMKYIERIQAGDLTHAHELAIAGYKETIADIYDLVYNMEKESA